MEVYFISKIKGLISIDKSIIAGIFFILLGFFILVTDYLDVFVTNLLWPLLEGSSEGKTVLFLGLIGSILILSSIIRQNPKIQERLYKSDNDYHLKYIAVMLVLLFCCAIFGLIIEAYIRQCYGVSFFTILTSMNYDTSTTSPMHSHIYKSVLGYVAYNFVPSHINTGSTILQFGLPYALIIIPVSIISYILGVIGISGMSIYHRIVGIVSLSLILIGIFDGGMFSQPFLIGLGFLLLLYFSNGKIGLKYFLKPVVIMGYVLLIAIIIEVGGSDMTEHTLTVINQTENVDMSEYNVTNIAVNGDATIYTINSTQPDKELIQEIFSTFKGKCDFTFMSWNFYSYLDNPTMQMRKNMKYNT